MRIIVAIALLSAVAFSVNANAQAQSAAVKACVDQVNKNFPGSGMRQMAFVEACIRNGGR